MAPKRPWFHHVLPPEIPLVRRWQPTSKPIHHLNGGMFHSCKVITLGSKFHVCLILDRRWPIFKRLTKRFIEAERIKKTGRALWMISSCWYPSVTGQMAGGRPLTARIGPSSSVWSTFCANFTAMFLPRNKGSSQYVYWNSQYLLNLLVTVWLCVFPQHFTMEEVMKELDLVLDDTELATWTN